jgi:small subunit ribosomal protein S16
MKRMGRRHRPYYRVCVIDSRKPRNGRAIEEVGHYDPMVRDKASRVALKLDRIDYWLSVGAQPSDKVAVLIKKVKLNKFGSASAPPPLTPPKPLPEPPAEATESADGEQATTEATEAATPDGETADS